MKSDPGRTPENIFNIFAIKIREEKPFKETKFIHMCTSVPLGILINVLFLQSWISLAYHKYLHEAGEEVEEEEKKNTVCYTHGSADRLAELE